TSPTRPYHHPNDRLHRLEDADDRLLVVERSPTPDEPIRDRAVERGMGPRALRAGLHRDHVLMSQEEDGPGGRIRSGPLEEEAPAVHELVREEPVRPRVRPREELPEPAPLARVVGRRGPMGDGPETDRRGEVLGGERSVEGCKSR